jgi:hypothetical protein
MINTGLEGEILDTECAQTGVAAGTSALLSPTPVVLVVGDFRSRDTFAWHAWERICAAYKDTDEAATIVLPEPTQALSVHPNTLVVGQSAHLSGIAGLYPLPFSDMGNGARQDVLSLMLQYLCSFNVVSIVACGTARNTRSMLNSLWPLLTPVMVTVDSTVQERSSNVARTYSYGSVLRLVPSNDLQAQAILARISTLAEQYAQSTIQIFSGGSNDYVLDLCRVLEDQLEYGATRGAAHFVSSVQNLESAPDCGILVCVGYHEAFQKIMSSGKKWRHIVLSDGCSDDRVTARAMLEKGAGEFYLSRPAFAHADYACDAYTAINLAWRSGRDTQRFDLAKNGSATRPFHRLVAATLENLWPSRYKFRGNENQRGGYLVERLSPVDKPRRSSVVHEAHVRR